MSTDVEDRLARALFAEADAAPPAGDLLVGVHARARQRGRRRIGITSVAAVVALTAGALGAATLPGRGQDALRTPDTVANGSADGPLVSGSAPQLQFPITPGWLPDGVARTPHVSLGQSGLEASYRDATPGRDGDLLGVDLWSSDHDVTFTGDGVTRRPTTVLGLPAVLATTAGGVSLGWQPTQGRWIALTASNRWASESIARHIADGLIEQPFNVASPFQLDVVPRDSELGEWTTDGRLVFVPTGQGTRWRNRGQVDGAVQIAVRRATADLTGRGEHVTVQGQPGWLLTESSGRKTLVVQLTSTIVLVVDTPAWDDADVLRLGEATHYTGGLPPQEG
jgi:hypothetical protein